jgi:hypothetical protein
MEKRSSFLYALLVGACWLTLFVQSSLFYWHIVNGRANILFHMIGIYLSNSDEIVSDKTAGPAEYIKSWSITIYSTVGKRSNNILDIFNRHLHRLLTWHWCQYCERICLGNLIWQEADSWYTSQKSKVCGFITMRLLIEI